jgi:hypothetical protein
MTEHRDRQTVLEQIDQVQRRLQQIEAHLDRLEQRNTSQHMESLRQPPASLVQQAYTSIQEHFIHTGRAPHFTDLAATLDITPDEARLVQKAAAAAGVGCWISPDTDYIASWAPFSNIPTQYLVTIDGEQKWYAQ